MKLGSPHVANGFACLLLAGIVFVACGSDEGRRSARDDAGAAGEGGDSFMPRGGNAGDAPTTSAGAGGQPRGVGGQPSGAAGELATAAGAAQLPVGGEGGTLSTAGAGGEGGVGGEPVVLDCDVIVIQNAQLEQDLRDAINKPTGEILASDVIGLTELGSYDVDTLAGVECLSDLTSLDLNRGGAPSTVADLTPLSFLKKLAVLDLSHIDPDDLAPLGKIPSLRVLSLSDAIRSHDLSPLAAAPALEELYLNNNVVEDLSSLAAISTLRKLMLESSTLNVPASLNALANVEILSLNSTALDLANINAMTQLKELHLANAAPRVGMASLSTLVNLTYLDLQTAGVTSIASLANMTKLVTLNLYLNDVADISALQGLTSLQTLYLQQNDVTDITPLVNNAGIGAGDTLQLVNNPLNCTSEGPKIAILVGRGANVASNCN
jgi:hypothetical protein